MDWLNSNTLQLMEKTLDVTWAKQRLTLENIANVDTPGYKAKYVDFEETLRSKLLSARSRGTSFRSSAVGEAIEETPMLIRESTEESMRLDGNNVNMDAEELELIRNVYAYQFALRQETDMLNRLKLAIQGR